MSNVISFPSRRRYRFSALHLFDVRTGAGDVAAVFFGPLFRFGTPQERCGECEDGQPQGQPEEHRRGRD